MRTVLIVGVGAALAGFAPAAAQIHGTSVGLNGGTVFYSAFNAGSNSTVELKPDPAMGYFGGIQLDWLVGNGIVGYRVAGHYQGMRLPWGSETRTIYAFAGDIDLILRPVAPNAGTMVIPFVSLGIGATHYRLGSGAAVSFQEAGAVYSGKERTKLSVLGGFGFDVVTRWGWDEGPFMIRVEAQDNFMLESPFEPIDGTEKFKGIHNIRLSIGLHNTMDLLR